MYQLSKEWAGLPNPEDSGKSYWKDVGTKYGKNVSGMSVDAVSAALDDIRQS